MEENRAEETDALLDFQVKEIIETAYRSPFLNSSYTKSVPQHPLALTI